MAKKVIVELFDDIDDTPIPEGTGESISFSLDGVEYSIDLNDVNAAAFRELLAPYIDNAERIGGRQRRSRGRAAAGRADTQAIRAWARDQGMQISDRGRIPGDIEAAYREAVGD